mmetsp:Transcript_39693/g.57973  ORF Transcript_39693/g.57973 Transcript_39693/m.57973 type:complete len:980 (+) Transcript_39693:487-3426(+)
MKNHYTTTRARTERVTLLVLSLVFLLSEITNGFTTRTIPSITTSSSSRIYVSSSSSSDQDRQGRRRGGGSATIATTSRETSSSSSHKKTTHHNQHSYNRTKRKVRSMFRYAKTLEKQGRWREASKTLSQILKIDPYDSYSHLALARLESRREQSNVLLLRHTTASSSMDDEEEIGGSKARKAFQRGTEMCPDSIHLWQAWALFEQSMGDIARAKELYEKALSIDSCNPYVCHAYGLMEQREDNLEHAKDLWEHALQHSSTAALVCSLGELHVSNGNASLAKSLYQKHVSRLTSEREMTEVYLAAAWLEEKHFKNYEEAEKLLHIALDQSSMGNSRVQVALAKLEGRKIQSQQIGQHLEGFEKDKNSKNKHDNSKGRKLDVETIQQQQINVMRKRFEEACNAVQNEDSGLSKIMEDGRLYNAWASLEVKSGHLKSARKILMRGIEQYPNDATLQQAAGKVEERFGNYTGARDLYGGSLRIEPSAPTLVAYAMLELRHPTETSAAVEVEEEGAIGNRNKKPKANFTMVERLFEEALLLDPKHGPVYNAYGNMELQRGDVAKARKVFERGENARCTDAASVYHGHAKLELSIGNVEKARDILVEGLQEVERLEGVMDNSYHERAAFLAHTLGMLELNANRAAQAKEVFANGISRHGTSSQLLLGSALCEVKLGREESARTFFEQAVNANKKHAQAWQAWGVMEMKAGNFKVAKTLFECGIQSAPTHGALWQAYATLESRLGNFETARILFAAGVQKCPKHVPLYQAWASLEMRGGNFNEAKLLIGEALTRDKTQGSGWLVAAKIEEKQGNEGLVGLILKRGLECAPNHAELYRTLAELEVNRFRFDAARSLLEKGLEVDPMHAPLYHSLAELEARVFNVDGLAKLNKRAAEVFNTNALVPPPASMQAWGNKIKMGRSNELIPDGVATLAEKVRVDIDIDNTLMDLDPDSIIEQMGGGFEADLDYISGEIEHSSTKQKPLTQQ